MEDQTSEFSTRAVGGVTVVRPDGWRVPPEMGDGLYRLLEGLDDPRVVLDMTGVRFLSSNGVAILVSLQKRVDARGGKLRICGLGPDLKELFRVTRMDHYLAFDADEAAALAAIGAG